MKKRLLPIVLLLLLFMAWCPLTVPGRAADAGETYTVHHTASFPGVGMGVSSGSEYQAGKTVTLTAFGQEGFQFRDWDIPDGLTLTEGNSKSKKISFTMPKHEVTLHENYDAVAPIYTINTVNNIDTGVGRYSGRVSGFPTQLSPLTPSKEGYRFSEWEGLEGLTVTKGDKYTEKVTIIMPDHDIKVKAIYISEGTTDAGETYNIHRVGHFDASNTGSRMMSIGTDRKYRAGESVTLTPMEEDGFHFLQWELPDGLTLTKGDSKTREISFIMPTEDMTISELHESVVPSYTIHVVNNIDSGHGLSRGALGGFEITLPTLSPSTEGYRFYAWESLEGLTIKSGDKYTEKVKIVMPKHNIDLKALYIRFDDVLPGAYYFDPVLWAVAQGITKGKTDTLFAPNDTCTTANIITFLWRVHNSPEPFQANPFSDVPAGAYYTKAAIWAYEKGMVSGGTFNGDSPCSRAATMKYLWILAGRPKSGKLPFKDVDPSADYAWAVAWAVESGITKGTTDTTFSPDNTCTRGQIVTFLHRHYAQ